MRSSIIAASFLAALAPQALANLYITSPVESTSCAAGQQCTVSWNDDGTTPALGTIGACDVALYVGSVTTQIKLQDLGSVALAQQAQAVFLPDASVGANSDLYFLRFTATNYFPDQANPTIPYEGFSAKFTLTGMTGSFNATVQSLMNGGSTGAAPSSTAGGSSTAGSPASTTGTATGAIKTTTKAASGTSSPTSSAPASSTSGAASAAFGVSSPAGALSAIVLSAFFAAAAF